MKPSSEEPSNQTQILVFWIMWFAILSGIFMMQFVISSGLPSGTNEREAPVFMVILAAVLTVISVVIRFILIPKATELLKLMPLMIIGLAISEGIGMLGIFVISSELPETKLIFFVTSVICILLYAPVYAKALIEREEMR